MYRYLFALLIIPFLSIGQDTDYRWWNEKHNWDGVTSWTKYLHMVPGRMGPNALPVQEIRDGSFSNFGSVETDIDFHSGKGYNTQNLFIKFHIPVAKNVAIQVWSVPYEQYETDTNTRDFRVARGKSGTGISSGDLYVSTLIYIVQDHKSIPDINFEIAIKTASGNNLEDARFTDTPGYYFDFSVGKDYELKPESDFYVRPYVMGGFYAYQTYRDDYYQNDCIMWGGGLDFKTNKWEVKNQIGGYFGYFQEFDKPMVYRLLLKYKLPKTHFQFQFQSGNGSYPFNSVRLGATFKLYELKS